MGSTSPPPRTLHIAILECDTPLPDVVSTYGKYTRIFTTLLTTAADRLNSSSPILPQITLKITSYDVVTAQEYPSLDSSSSSSTPSTPRPDAILLTGSKHTAFDSDPWITKLVSYTKNVLSQQPGNGIKLIGICFGHQIIARALGAPLARSERGWEVSVLPMRLSAKGQDIFSLPGQNEREELLLHQMHRDIVVSYPEGVEGLGTSAKCETQGMYAKGRLLTVQGHPEFNEGIVDKILDTRHGMGVFDDETWADGKKRVGKAHDGVVVAVGVLRFLLEG